MSTEAPRKNRPQAILRVKERIALSPRLVRLVLGGEGFDSLNRNPHSDSYIKLLLPQPGSGLTPPFDLEAIRETQPESLPSRRTYTVRRWCDDTKEIWVDFVLHMEEGARGIASDWAAEAKQGDEVAAMGAGGAYTPREDAALHLLIGDHAAVPAIAASLERLPEGVPAIALLHVDHEEDVLAEFPAPRGSEVRWIVGEREQLLREVAALDIPARVIDERGIHVFCHAERGLTKDLRAHLVKERGIAREDISISAYWALGRIEDQFQAEKREAIGKIDPDE